MALAPLAASILLGFQSPAAAPPDRSGEAAFKKILTWAKGLDKTHLIILPEQRDSAIGAMYPGSRIDLWLDGNKFRLETSGMWGDGSLVVSDGESVLSDSFSDYEAVNIANAKGGLLTTMSEIKQPLADRSPFFALMAGPEEIDKLVEKTASIKQEPDRADEKAISYPSKKLGSVRLLYHEEKGKDLLDAFEYDNLPSAEEDYKKFPEWMDPPEPGMLTRHRIVITTDRPSSAVFKVQVPKGREVEDKRAKKGKR